MSLATRSAVMPDSSYFRALVISLSLRLLVFILTGSATKGLFLYTFKQSY